MKLDLFGPSSYGVLPHKLFVVDDSYTPLARSSSKGNQEKYLDNIQDYYIKVCFQYSGRYWKDNLVEILATRICNQLDIPVVSQGLCTVERDGETLNGSYSSNFLRPVETFITYNEMLCDRPEIKSNSLLDRFNFQLGIYKEYISEEDARQYLEDMHLIDCIVLNEDRHYNNYGVVYNNMTRTYRKAELFDFGLGLFEHSTRYSGCSYKMALEKVSMKNISSSPLKLLQYLCMYGTDETKSRLSRLGTLDLVDSAIPNKLAYEHLTNIRKGVC